jgi:hypothetical protein
MAAAVQGRFATGRGKLAKNWGEKLGLVLPETPLTRSAIKSTLYHKGEGKPTS